MIRILVFDSNIVFAKRVAETLEQLVSSALVDTACNVPILRRRLREHGYNLILADVLTAQNMEEAASLLVSESKKSVFVVFWTSVNPAAAERLLRGCQPASGVVPKPYAVSEVRDTVSPFVEQVSV